jgi:diguanylate cyclase (GGDEF)-like protein
VIRALRGYISSRVSRRLFVLFVLCAFLPLAAIAIVSLLQVRSLLQQQGETRLVSTAKAYGMTLFERLVLAHELALAAAVKGSVPTGNSMEVRNFRALAIVDETGAGKTLLGTPHGNPLAPEALQRLALGKPVVRVSGGAAMPTIEVIAALNTRPARYALAELRPDFLWGPADELPTATDFCVMEERWSTPLYCSAPMPGAFKGETRWVRDRETYRSKSWTQFMRAGFGTPDWTIIASQPEAYHLAKASEFGQVYVPVVLLALLLATWLTIRQSRDIVEPMEKLADRARGVARQDFSTRLDLDRADEFGSLAVAFNQMSQLLGRQFASLTALSEIDRMILATQDTAEVVRTVLRRLVEVTAADCVTLTLFDQDDPDHARTYFLPPDDAEGGMLRHEMTADERAHLQQLASAEWVRVDSSTEGYLAHARTLGIASAFVQPIAWRGKVCGAIVVGRRQPQPASEDEMQATRELGDRVAVAVSSAWRDQQLYTQSHFDVVTGAPNRLLFTDRLDLEVVRSRREGLTFALLFVDLDHFKNVNDSYGHSVGDAVLREAATRIATCIRATDSLARLGGDEFTVLLTNLGNPQEAWLISETIVTAMSREFVVGEQRCFLSASIGIASYPADGETAEDLLKCADTAMYRAKAGGRGQSVFYEQRMNEEAVARVSLDRDLRVALERGELAVHYQPQWDMASGAIVGAEALVRWNHPVRGMISPGRFIALAEESGFIEQLGQWITLQACRDMQSWRAQGLAIGHVSVNVSPRQFRRRALVDFFRQAVHDTRLPAHCLQIEITEGLLVDRGEHVEAMLHELAAMGHRIALDDFGTGFSSMAYLKRFPVHVIKIDRAFVEGLDRTTDSEAIVAAIIAMSHALGKIVVAEGVETAEQATHLRRLRCDVGQGFLLSPAVPASAFIALARHQPTVEALG